MEKINSKWDKWRLIVLWWSEWTTFTIRNACESAMRAWAWVVVAFVKKWVWRILESNSWFFKIKEFVDYQESSSLEVLDFVNRSKCLVAWMGIEDSEGEITDFFLNIIKNTNKTLLFDADVIPIIQKNKEVLINRSWNNDIVLTMNISEKEKYFQEDNPKDDFVINEAQELRAWIVLKWIRTSIYSPKWEVIHIDTDRFPEMANAGAWDVLSWIIWAFLAQWYFVQDSILKWIKAREDATRYYLEKTGDIIAHPLDIIWSIRYIIKEVV